MMEAVAERVLFIDTCGVSSLVALLCNGLVVGERVLPERTASAHLLEAIRELLVEHPVPSAIVVVSGPGSFTGVRVGLSAAKAFAEVWQIPLFGISRLELMGHSMKSGFAVMDAGRGQFYVRDLAAQTETLEPLVEWMEQALEASLPIVAEPALAEKLPNAIPFKLELEAAYPALQKLLEGPAVDAALLDANYVRSEAAIYGGKKGA